MPVVPIDSLDDPRVRHYRNLKDRELARQGGLFIAEAEHVVRRLLESDFAIESVLVAQRRLARIAPLVAADTTLFVAPDELVNRIIGFKFHSGVIACGRRKEAPTLEQIADLPRGGEGGAGRLTLVVCPQVINHDNLGALVRIAAGFGADAMLLGEQSCDAYWRRSIRVSMGAVFRLPIRHSADLLADLRQLRDRWAVQVIATVVGDDAEPLAGAQRAERIALVFGSESQGLDQRCLEACDRRVTIPMKLGTDSLNVAVAAAVCLYHFTMQV